MIKRIITAFVIFAVISALALLLPRSLRGEIAAASLTPHAAPQCTQCPPGERLSDVGMLAAEGKLWVNVRFAAAPTSGSVTLEFDGVPGRVELHRDGNQWLRLDRQSMALPELSSVAGRGNLVVFALPQIAARGVAVSSASGDRIPAFGYVKPIYPAPAHFNLVDAMLLVVLVLTAFYGFKRGPMAELSDLAAISCSLAISMLLFRPLAHLVASWIGYMPAAVAMTAGMLLLVWTAIGFALMPRMAVLLRPLVKGLGSLTGGAVAAVLACLRQLPMLATVLMIGIDVALLRWAAPEIASSLLGSPLLSAARSMFPAG